MKQRKTKQKETLEKELSYFNAFFTAEDLHQKAKKKDISIGIATVYRFLQNIRKKQQLHSYTCERRIIYSKKSNHCHYICQKCGKQTHINIESIDFIKRKVEGTLCHFQIDIHGICKNCQKNETT